MELTSSEHEALKETFEECKTLSNELNVPLSDVIQLRQLLLLEWAVKTWCNQTPRDK